MAFRKIYNLLCCNQTLHKVYLHNGIPRYILNPLNVSLLEKSVKKIMTWNIQELFLYTSESKLDKIIDYIANTNCDVLCLQEVFEIHSLEKILFNKDILKKYPFSITGCMKSKYIFGENSGLLILTNQPIRYIRFVPLMSYEFPDSLASKGILYFSVGDRNFASTHLQSGNEILAAQQMLQVRDSSPFGSDFILLGDLNHRKVDIYLRCQKNNIVRTHDSDIILDYIVPMNENYCSMNVVVDDVEIEGISDHWPLICTFD